MYNSIENGPDKIDFISEGNILSSDSCLNLTEDVQEIRDFFIEENLSSGMCLNTLEIKSSLLNQEIEFWDETMVKK